MSYRAILCFGLVSSQIAIIALNIPFVLIAMLHFKMSKGIVGGPVWGMTSCWNHVSVIEKHTALHHMTTHNMDHAVSWDAKARKRITNINKACGFVVSGADTANNDAAQLAMPGYVHASYNVVNKFDVSASWLNDMGWPHDLAPEEHASKHQGCVYEAKAFNFNTANGNSVSHTRLHVSICILPQTPSVLPVGERSHLILSFVWLAGKQPFWLTPSGIVVPRSVHNNVPYLEDRSKSLDSFAALTSVGLSRDQGKCESSLATSRDKWAAAAATHAPDDDVYWEVVAGRRNKKNIEDTREVDTESNYS